MKEILKSNPKKWISIGIATILLIIVLISIKLLTIKSIPLITGYKYENIYVSENSPEIKRLLESNYVLNDKLSKDEKNAQEFYFYNKKGKIIFIIKDLGKDNKVSINANGETHLYTIKRNNFNKVKINKISKKVINKEVW